MSYYKLILPYMEKQVNRQFSLIKNHLIIEMVNYMFIKLIDEIYADGSSS